jgi:tetratricopeptide (TPR) repeat protein
MNHWPAETTRRFHARRALLLAGALLGCTLAARPAAGDTVVYATGQDRRDRSTAMGTIVDWTGQQLVLQRQSGAESSIPTSHLVQVDFARTALHQQADRLFAAGAYEEAVRSYVQAASAESREWVQRMLVAGLVQAYAQLGQIDRAGRAFLQLLRSDPATHHFPVIPLCWRSEAGQEQWRAQAETWLQTADDPAARLMGASWLLSGPRRGDAITVLQQLVGQRDRRIVFLAQAQLWRTRVVTAERAEVEGWEATVQRMPADLRGGPYYVLGEAWNARQEHQRAALAFLRVPILYADQLRLVPWALLSAGRALEKIDQVQQALTLYRELLRDYPEHPAAADARALVER